jgi:hypothetical protein
MLGIAQEIRLVLTERTSQALKEETAMKQAVSRFISRRKSNSAAKS